jgi:hypothetical protein
MTYIKNTEQGALRGKFITNIYNLQRKGEPERYLKDNHNRHDTHDTTRHTLTAHDTQVPEVGGFAQPPAAVPRLAPGQLCWYVTNKYHLQSKSRAFP